MFRSFFTTIFRGSSAVLCAVTIPPADLRSLSSYYYTVCGRMCMSSVCVFDVLVCWWSACKLNDPMMANWNEETLTMMREPLLDKKNKELHYLLSPQSISPISIVVFCPISGSSVRIATELRAGRCEDRIPVGAKFSARPDRPWFPTSLLYNGYRVFPGGKVRRGRAADPLPLYSAEVLVE